MKVGFSKPTREAADQERLFALFGPTGFDGLQLKISQYRDYLEDPAAFRDRYGAYPGVASGVIVGGPLDDAGTALLRSILRFAGAVGSERVVYWPGAPHEDTPNGAMREFARAMSELGQEAHAQGTKLSLHHHYSQIVMTRADIDRFFTLVDDGTVGLTVDTAHLVKSGVTDVAGVIRDHRQVIDNIHMKDYADGEWRVLGTGGIDFAPIFAAVREIGFTGWVCADEESGSELQGAMRDCFQFLEAGLSLSRGRA